MNLPTLSADTDKLTNPPHIVTLVLIAAMSAVPMNMFVAALPAMATFYDTSYGIMQLAITGYLFMTGITQMIAGPLSDRFGRRPVLLGAFALFIAASIGCALAPNIEVFLFFRGVQAVSASGVALSRTIARDIVGPLRAASLIGYVTMGMALAPMLSPPIGGILQEHFGWQSNFYLMAAIGVVIFSVMWFDLGETNKTLSSSIAAQWRMYPELLRSQRFWGYALTSAFSAGGFFAFLGGAPYVGVEVYGLSPSTLGMFFAIPAIGYMAGNGISGRFAASIGIQNMMLAGCAVSSLMLLAALLVQYAGLTHPIAFFGFTFFIGLGNGITLPSANVGLMSIKPELAGSASGLGGALMTFFGAGTSALSIAILVRSTGAPQLILCILATLTLAFCTALYTTYRERVVASPEV
jgi:DHA1 family bicyclomycin/chloramphenicol resistance-like MFS transporter